MTTGKRPHILYLQPTNDIIIKDPFEHEEISCGDEDNGYCSENSPLIRAERRNNNSLDREGSFLNNSFELGTGVSCGVAAFLLVNAALGAGMLNYPYAYNQIGGILPALLIQAVLLIFIGSTMLILVYCADFNNDDTYHKVLLSMCGKRAQQLAALSILLTCYGINITFLVIIGDQYDRMFTSLMPDQFGQAWYLDRKFSIFITAVLFIWPMCYAKSLNFLRHASVLGMFAMLYVAFLTVYEHYQLEVPHKPTLAEHLPITAATATIAIAGKNASIALAKSQTNKGNTIEWYSSLAVVPILCFAYQTHEIIVPVYACMKGRCLRQFIKATFLGLVILFILYNLVGIYGYMTFGSRVDPDIMSLYNAKDPVVIVGVIALIIKFITTYPPLMFCGRGALEGLYAELRNLPSEEKKSTQTYRRIALSTIWFLSTIALAIFAPDISVTLQLLGSMASINVFVFPGMCLISLTNRLRTARVMVQKHARDYYLITGSYFNALKKSESRLLAEEVLASRSSNSATNSLLDQLEASIAPAIVSQKGISMLTALGLYLFSFLLIAFGVFIFILEMIDVLGFSPLTS